MRLESDSPAEGEADGDGKDESEGGGGRRENEEARGMVTWQDARTMVRMGEEEGGEGDGSEIPN
jgi:hypothetical protein